SRVTPRSTLFPYTTLFRSSMYSKFVVVKYHCGLAGPSAFPIHKYLADVSEEISSIDKSIFFNILLRFILITCCFFPLTSLDKLRSEEHTSELQSRENLVCL